MRPYGAVAFVLFAGLALSAASPQFVRAECVSGEVVAEMATEPGYQGLYKYTLTVTWDLDRHDLSHLDFFLELQNCECICDDRFVQFTSPAGQSSDGGCVSQYEGDYVCMGDPSLPPSFWSPAVKFEPSGDCEPGLSGSGTFCFYSPMPPVQNPVDPDGLAIKHGQEICTGSLSGQFPACECALQQETHTWGQVKAFYR